jgi:hypothetical protein
VRVATRDRQQEGNGRAECGDLRQREIDEDDAALDDVDAKVSLDSREHEARHERRGEEGDDAGVHGYDGAPVCFMALTRRFRL